MRFLSGLLQRINFLRPTFGKTLHYGDELKSVMAAEQRDARTRIDEANRFSEEEFFKEFFNLPDKIFSLIGQRIYSKNPSREPTWDMLFRIAPSLRKLQLKEEALSFLNVRSEREKMDSTSVFVRENEISLYHSATEKLSRMGFIYWTDVSSDFPPFELLGKKMWIDQRVVNRLVVRDDLIAELRKHACQRGIDLSKLGENSIESSKTKA